MLGFNCGLDFETRIMVKANAPAMLRKGLSKPSWKGEPILMAGVTDCYQPLEKKHRITRGCLKVMAACGQPVSMVTKNRLIVRDLDVLQSLNSARAVSVAISVTTLDHELSMKLEPRASSPRDRLTAIAKLSSAGVPVTVMVAPIIPGLTDCEVPAILEAAAQAGAKSAGYVMLRLPYQVKDLFIDWLARNVPLRASHVETLIRDVRGGALNSAQPGDRMRGRGPIAEQIRSMMEVFCQRYGLNRGLGEPTPAAGSFRRPGDEKQMTLF